MDLNILWFILIAVLFTGFFFLEGFDFGVGILLLLIGKKDSERRTVINSIGPFWDGNEVWIITAGGAIFAAFPNWYATMFSGFYIPLLIILAALILRGVSFEFRSKNESKRWRENWDRIIFVSNTLLAILWGTALANLIKGVPIDKNMNFTGGFFSLISIYTLAAGIAALLIFMFHGAVFLSLKTEGVLQERAIKYAKSIGIYAAASAVLLIILSKLETNIFSSNYSLISAIMSFIILCISLYFVRKRRSLISFILNGISIALSVTALFLGLFPKVMVSSINTEYSLTIYNAASSHNTLLLMTKVALIFLPIVLAYQAWTYWIFRKRVNSKELEY